MAYLEAAVVTYFRAALGSVRTAIPLGLHPIPTLMPRVELSREIATLIMLAMVGWLVCGSLCGGMGWTLIAFGTWDIGYYAWLRLLTGWPTSLGVGMCCSSSRSAGGAGLGADGYERRVHRLGLATARQ